MKILLSLLLYFFTIGLPIYASDAFENLRGYAVSDKNALSYNYVFDISFASTNLLLSSYGLSRFSKHQDEINVIYGANLIINSLHLYRTFSILNDRGLFQKAYTEVAKVENKKLRNKIAEYRLMELSNSIRQFRKITASWGLISSLFVAAFSEGNKIELAKSFFLFGNSIFYLFFYTSYGEDAYDKYFFYKKAYPEIAFNKDFLIFKLNFIF